MHALDHGEDHHVLSRSELAPQDVELWHHAHDLADVVNLRGDVKTANLGRTLSGLSHTREHREKGGFTRAVVAEKTEKLAVWDF